MARKSKAMKELERALMSSDTPSKKKRGKKAATPPPLAKKVGRSKAFSAESLDEMARVMGGAKVKKGRSKKKLLAGGGKESKRLSKLEREAAALAVSARKSRAMKEDDKPSKANKPSKAGKAGKAGKGGATLFFTTKSGLKRVRPHPSMNRKPCKTCGRIHTPGQHAFHGAGSYARTHYEQLD